MAAGGGDEDTPVAATLGAWTAGGAGEAPGVGTVTFEPHPEQVTCLPAAVGGAENFFVHCGQLKEIIVSVAIAGGERRGVWLTRAGPGSAAWRRRWWRRRSTAYRPGGRRCARRTRSLRSDWWCRS